MVNKVIGKQSEISRPGWLYKAGGTAAILGGVLLLIGLLGLVNQGFQSNSGSGWLAALGNNWLIKIFILHATDSASSDRLMNGLNILDIVFLAIAGLIGFSLSTTRAKSARVWLLISTVLCLAGIILFIATALTGRSTVMLVVMIISVVGLWDKFFDNLTNYAGLMAGILLLAGDLTVGIHSDIITVLYSAGYLLLVAWFFLVAKNLFGLARGF